jgi:hypothetical protein
MVHRKRSASGWSAFCVGRNFATGQNPSVGPVPDDSHPLEFEIIRILAGDGGLPRSAAAHMHRLLDMAGVPAQPSAGRLRPRGHESRTCRSGRVTRWGSDRNGYPVAVTTSRVLSIALQDTGRPPLRPLPIEAAELLLHEVDAPPRLVAHLRAVHDVAGQLLEREG